MYCERTTRTTRTTTLVCAASFSCGTIGMFSNRFFCFRYPLIHNFFSSSHSFTFHMAIYPFLTKSIDKTDRHRRWYDLRYISATCIAQDVSFAVFILILIFILRIIFLCTGNRVCAVCMKDERDVVYAFHCSYLRVYFACYCASLATVCNR